MRTLNDLLSVFRAQVLVYMDDHYFCDCSYIISPCDFDVNVEVFGWCTIAGSKDLRYPQTGEIGKC